MKPHHATRAKGLISIGLILLLSVACQKEDPRSLEEIYGTDDPLLKSPEATEEPLSDEEAATEAFYNFFTVLGEATAIPDPEYPALDDIAKEEARESIDGILQSHVTEGTKTMGNAVLVDVTTETIEDSDSEYTLVVKGCLDFTAEIIVDAETNNPIEDEEYGTTFVAANYEQDDSGQWYANYFEYHGLGSCLGKPELV